MSFEVLTFNLVSPRIHREHLEGRVHIVAPAVGLAEGVWAGTNGPILYTAEDLSREPHTWNHRPVVVYHPQSGSACEPSVLNNQKVGVLLNSKWEGSKLRFEVWLDEERLQQIDPRILQALERGEKVEVSTGLYTNQELSVGEWKGKRYIAIARDLRPDHLAILPDARGAMSVADGAGLLANAASRSLDYYVQNAPAHLRADIMNALAFQESERTRLVSVIVANQANQANRFNLEWLKIQPIDVLAGIAQFTQTPDERDRPMYFGAQGVDPNSFAYEEEGLEEVVMNFDPPGYSREPNVPQADEDENSLHQTTAEDWGWEKDYAQKEYAKAQQRGQVPPAAVNFLDDLFPDPQW